MYKRPEGLKATDWRKIYGGENIDMSGDVVVSLTIRYKDKIETFDNLTVGSFSLIKGETTDRTNTTAFRLDTTFWANRSTLTKKTGE